jgi:hypothetical protein
MRSCDCRSCRYEDVGQKFIVFDGLNFCPSCAKKILHFLLQKKLDEEG